MQTISIRTDDIETGERHRALSSDAVARLAASIKDIGLIQPITVRVVEEMVVDGELTSGVPVLVAGHHRLAAAKSLGWSHIECIEVDDDALRAELVEIAENLHRLDLTKGQRDEHIRRYAELLAERAKVVPTGTLSKPETGRGNKGIARQIADATGLSKKVVSHALNPRPIRAALSDQEVVLRQAEAIVSAWNRASPEARDIALSQIDGPVFDRAAA